MRIGDIYQIKVTLQDVEPAVWRRLQVPAEITLSRLHLVLQLAMGWQNYHLHEFRIGESVYGEPNVEFDDDRRIKDDRRARLSRAASSVGVQLTYLYDFGDDWTHEIVVERVGPREPRTRYPRVTGGARRMPARGCRRPLELRRIPCGNRRSEARATRGDARVDRLPVRRRVLRPGRDEPRIRRGALRTSAAA